MDLGSWEPALKVIKKLWDNEQLKSDFTVKIVPNTYEYCVKRIAEIGAFPIGKLTRETKNTAIPIVIVVNVGGKEELPSLCSHEIVLQSLSRGNVEDPEQTLLGLVGITEFTQSTRNVNKLLNMSQDGSNVKNGYIASLTQAYAAERFKWQNYTACYFAGDKGKQIRGLYDQLINKVSFSLFVSLPMAMTVQAGEFFVSKEKRDDIVPNSLLDSVSGLAKITHEFGYDGLKAGMNHWLRAYGGVEPFIDTVVEVVDSLESIADKPERIFMDKYVQDVIRCIDKLKDVYKCGSDFYVKNNFLSKEEGRKAYQEFMSSIAKENMQ